MSRFDEVRRTCGRGLGLLVAGALALLGGVADAQTCDVVAGSPQTSEPWQLNGSDTLEQIMRQGIVQATAEGVLASCGNRCQTANQVVTKGHCSTTTTQACSSTGGGVACPSGQTCVADASQSCVSSPDTCGSFHALATCRSSSELYYAGGGSTTGETALRNNAQSIAPMSRNFRDTVLFTSAAQTTRRSFCADAPATECTTNAAACPGGAANCVARRWDQIYARNVVGLDAGVIVENRGGGRQNLVLPIVGTDESIAAPNTDPGNFSFLAPGTGYTQILAIVLGGVDGSGSWTACSDPRRINAIQDLANFVGAPSGTVGHFYRRDDNSGTTDTFKERLRIDRFCNGRAVGINGTNKTLPSLNNQDYDPIRRPCALLPGQRESACTDVTVTPPVVCRPGDGNPNCTQGLVVALSVGDNDTNLADVTTTIGSRISLDPDSVGFAGREAVTNASLATFVRGPNIRGRSSGDNSVRLGLYMLSRRLFLQFADRDGDQNTADPITTNSAASASGQTGGVTQRDAEVRFWNWATEPGVGRCNLDPIVRNLGFISCLSAANCSEDVCSFDPTNICCNPNPAPLFAGLPAACAPGASGAGPTFWPVDDGNAATNLGNTCTSGQICCSTGLTCPASGVCPEVARLPSNYPCGKNSDCASGVCSDSAAIGINICN